mmetsp:Transcript_1203/g.3353  ORF Transcript_1203/g.3353 Transcript_1203/m.3353 type:complete len:781 (-) Transcript_1203:65-2407(-)
MYGKKYGEAGASHRISLGCSFPPISLLRGIGCFLADDLEVDEEEDEGDGGGGGAPIEAADVPQAGLGGLVVEDASERVAKGQREAGEDREHGEGGAPLRGVDVLGKQGLGVGLRHGHVQAHHEEAHHRAGRVLGENEDAVGEDQRQKPEREDLLLAQVVREHAHGVGEEALQDLVARQQQRQRRRGPAQGLGPEHHEGLGEPGHVQGAHDHRREVKLPGQGRRVLEHLPEPAGGLLLLLLGLLLLRGGGGGVRGGVELWLLDGGEEHDDGEGGGHGGKHEDGLVGGAAEEEGGGQGRAEHPAKGGEGLRQGKGLAAVLAGGEVRQQRVRGRGADALAQPVGDLAGEDPVEAHGRAVGGLHVGRGREHGLAGQREHGAHENDGRPGPQRVADDAGEDFREEGRGDGRALEHADLGVAQAELLLHVHGQHRHVHERGGRPQQLHQTHAPQAAVVARVRQHPVDPLEEVPVLHGRAGGHRRPRARRAGLGRSGALLLLVTASGRRLAVLPVLDPLLGFLRPAVREGGGPRGRGRLDAGAPGWERLVAPVLDPLARVLRGRGDKEAVQGGRHAGGRRHHALAALRLGLPLVLLLGPLGRGLGGLGDHHHVRQGGRFRFRGGGRRRRIGLGLSRLRRLLRLGPSGRLVPGQVLGRVELLGQRVEARRRRCAHGPRGHAPEGSALGEGRAHGLADAVVMVTGPRASTAPHAAAPSGAELRRGRRARSRQHPPSPLDGAVSLNHLRDLDLLRPLCCRWNQPTPIEEVGCGARTGGRKERRSVRDWGH